MPNGQAPRPKVLVLFPDDWAPYSPTLTRLVERLGERADVIVYAIHTGRFTVEGMPTSIYRPVMLSRWIRRIGLYGLVRPFALAYAARTTANSASHIIAVDTAGAIAARLLGTGFHFLSLELGHRWLVRPLLRHSSKSILIQSRARLHYLLGEKLPPGVDIHFVQNAPDAVKLRLEQCLADPRRYVIRLVYLGNIIPIHGLQVMLALLRAWPEAQLTLQGNFPAASERFIKEHAADLVTSGRLLLPKGYIAEQDLNSFLGKHDIGVCLYDLKGRQQRNFNYVSSPAGKMFNYFAAGIPVLASAHIGLAPVSEHQAGLQVAELCANTLAEAGKTIAANLEHYRAGARRAALAYDFHSATESFLDSIEAVPHDHG